jgi:hypothetical protein
VTAEAWVAIVLAVLATLRAIFVSKERATLEELSQVLVDGIEHGVRFFAKDAEEAKVAEGAVRAIKRYIEASTTPMGPEDFRRSLLEDALAPKVDLAKERDPRRPSAEPGDA